MRPRLLVILATLTLWSLALAQTTPEIQQTSLYLKQQSNNVLQQYMTGMLGPNPLDGLFGQASLVTQSALYKVWVGLSLVIAVMGLAVSISNVPFSDSDAVKHISRIVGKFVVTLAIISSAFSTQPWSLYNVITKSVAGSYVFGIQSFSGDFNAKLDQTRDSFTDMLGSTLVVGMSFAIPEGAGALRAGTLALTKSYAKGEGARIAATESLGAASTGLKAAGKKVVGFVMNKLGGLFTALQLFLNGYGALVTSAGWLTVLILLALPIGLALLNFNETRVIWSVFGTWIGVAVALTIMPAVLVSAIDTALIQPVKSMQYYTAELGYQAQLQQAEAAKAKASTQTEMNTMLNQCQDARIIDPANIDSNPCQKIVNQGALVQFGNWLQGSVAQKIGDAIEGILANMADTFVSFGVMVMRLLMGLVFAGLLMFGVPVAAITMFSGVAIRK